MALDDLELEAMLAKSKVFVDTCSLMHPASETFFYRTLPPILQRAAQKMIVPHKVVQEVEKLQKTGNADHRRSAGIAATVIKSYLEKGMVDIRGEATDPFADNLFIEVFTKFKTKHNLILLTQDNALSADIAGLKDLRSVRSSKDITVLRLNEDGTVRRWVPASRGKKAPSTPPKSPSMPSKTPATRMETFAMPSSPVSQQEHPLGVAAVPGEGDHVTVRQAGRIKLLKTVGRGGEGEIFATDKGPVCKVYFPSKLTREKFDKLELMLSRRVSVPGVCWPTDIVTDERGQPVGYLMPKAAGLPMQRSMFIKDLLKKNFPHWDRLSLVTLCLTIISKIQTLHERNILIGDINPQNILIQSEREVFFVDTDSFQVEGYPCPVGMVNFTAPEIQGTDFRTFLRTPAHEQFAVATLLFMILLPGKPPYSQQGGGDPGSNIRGKDFSYPFGDKSNKKTPEGPWRYIWSNLPYKVKEAFYDCFRNDRRPSLADWRSLLIAYKSGLEKGHFTLELYPTTLKALSQHAQQEYGVKSSHQSFTCHACAQTFTVPDKIAATLAHQREVLCFDCMSRRREESTTGDSIRCQDCGGTFIFSIADQRFYASKGFTRPKRCQDCRANRKGQSSATPRTGYSYNSPSAPTPTPAQSSFLDDIYELMKGFFGR